MGNLENYAYTYALQNVDRPQYDMLSGRYLVRYVGDNGKWTWKSLSTKTEAETEYITLMQKFQEDYIRRNSNPRIRGC